MALKDRFGGEKGNTDGKEDMKERRLRDGEEGR